LACCKQFQLALKTEYLAVDVAWRVLLANLFARRVSDRTLHALKENVACLRQIDCLEIQIRLRRRSAIEMRPELHFHEEVHHDNSVARNAATTLILPTMAASKASKHGIIPKEQPDLAARPQQAART
jgi:hypothetical protein